MVPNFWSDSLGYASIATAKRVAYALSATPVDWAAIGWMQQNHPSVQQRAHELKAIASVVV